MGEKITARFDGEQVAGFNEMQDDDAADSTSEAVRQAAAVGLHEMGYVNGATEQKANIEHAGEVVGWLFGVAALAWLGVTLFYPVEVRLPALAALAASLSAFGVARAAGHGPLRERLAAVVGGGSA